MIQDTRAVYIVDDDEAVREGVSSLLRSVGLRTEMFASPEELLAKGTLAGANCLILDVRLPTKSGLEFQRDLAASNNRTPIIFLTGHGDVPMSVRAMKGGAFEFLIKPFREQELLDAVHQAIHLDTARRRDEASLSGLQARFASLTARERDVMKWLIAGRINKEIGASLGTAESTIKAHRGQVMRKMGANSLPELVRMADRLGVKTHATD